MCLLCRVEHGVGVIVGLLHTDKQGGRVYGTQMNQGKETGTLFSLGVPGVSYGGHFIHTLSTATLSPEGGVANSLSPRLWGTWHNGVHVNSTQ